MKQLVWQWQANFILMEIDDDLVACFITLLVNYELTKIKKNLVW